MINDYLKQSKLILDTIDIKSEYCPFEFSCGNCVVNHYLKKYYCEDALCSIKLMMEISKYHLRNEKLKKIQNDK